MQNFRDRLALLSIRSKILAALFFGCIVIAFSWAISRIVFKETFTTIEVISKPNPKLRIINSLFQKIQKLDYTQRVQVLKGQNKSYETTLKASDEILEMLDSLAVFCKDDTAKTDKIRQMKNILYERDELFFNYLKFRYHIQKNNPLSKDIQNLSQYITQNISKNDSNVVRTTVKNTITTTILSPESIEKKAEKKEPFFKRVFSRKKTQEEAGEAPTQLITQNVQETIDTFAVTQRDSFLKDMERAIVSIEKDRFTRRNTLIHHELKLTSASNFFINELEQLLRQVQLEEIDILQKSTENLSGVFDSAFNWVEIILCGFLVLILILIFFIFSDISRSNKIKLQLIEAKERAEHLEQVKHRFLANMSHEIRTPLQAIIGYSEQVKDQDKPEKHSLEAIYRSSEHLLQIVNEVLDYSRIISGKFVFETQDFEMQEVVAEVADIMEGQAEKKGITFGLKSDSSLNHFYAGDPFRLKQILFNLLGNAIKFTQAGEVFLKVSAQESDTGKTEFVFEISDTGTGMTGEEMDRIFNTFEQAGQTIQRQFGGTGLGLSISRKLIEMQGGTIEVRSEKDKGSTFTVRLSYLKTSAPAPDEQTYAQPIPVNNLGKIMVVDDDAFILQLCSTILNKYGIAHTCFNASEKVLADTWDDEITIVLLDIRMPVINGIELFYRLKKKVRAGVRFVALTAQALPDEKNAVLEQGFNQILLKPFREKELLDVIHRSVIEKEKPGTSKADAFDLSAIKHMCMQDAELFEKTLELFVRETSLDVSNLSDGLERRHYEKIAESAHRLSSKVGQVGMHQLAHTLRQVEHDARRKQTSLYKEYRLNGLIREIKELIALIEKQRLNH